MDKAAIARKIKEKLGGKVEPESEQQVDENTPFLVPNRQNKRRTKQYGAVTGTSEVHDALRRGAFRGRKKTGQPLWFRRMKYEAERRKALEKVTMDRLEPAVGRIALDLFHAGYETVWEVAQAESAKEFLQYGRHDNRDIAIDGRDLKKLRAYLVQQRVPVKWEV